jgi:hypothetical protein
VLPRACALPRRTSTNDDVAVHLQNALPYQIQNSSAAKLEARFVPTMINMRRRDVIACGNGLAERYWQRLRNRVGYFADVAI